MWGLSGPGSSEQVRVDSPATEEHGAMWGLSGPGANEQVHVDTPANEETMPEVCFERSLFDTDFSNDGSVFQEKLRYFDGLAVRVARLERQVDTLLTVSGAAAAASSAPMEANLVAPSAAPPAPLLPVSLAPPTVPCHPGLGTNKVAAVFAAPDAKGRAAASGSSVGASTGTAASLSRFERNRQLQEALRLHSTHRIAATTWEMGAYFGLPFLGHGTQVAIVFGFVLNVVIQMAFCIIIAESFIDGDLTMTPQQAEKFRRELGHDYRNMDRYGWVSLTARVCGGDPSLEIATEQVRAVDIIEEYTKPSWLLGVPSGAMLCSVVLVVWVLSMISDVIDTVSLQLAMSSLPRGRRTVMEISGGHFRFCAISWSRYVSVTVLTLVRLAVGVTLLVLGGMYLGRTTEIKDLVLNAAALGFILEVDELLFETLAPLEVQTLVDALEPLPKPIGCTWYGLGSFSLGSLLATVVCVALLVRSTTLETLSTLREIEWRLCSEGLKDFIVRAVPSGEVAIGSTQPYESPFGTQALEAYVAKEIISGQRGLHNTSIGSQVKVSQWRFTSTTDRMTIDYIAGRLGGVPCADARDNFLDNQSRPWKQLDLSIGTGTELRCEDFAHQCDQPEQSFLRALCSKTCKCDEPLSGSLYHGPENGCLPRCHDRFLEAFAALPCEDIPASEFSNNNSNIIRLLRNQLADAHFLSWVGGEDNAKRIAVFGDSADPDTVVGIVLRIAEGLNGCELIAQMPNFCMFGGAGFCPKSCNCLDYRPMGRFFSNYTYTWDSCPRSCGTTHSEQA